VKVLQSTDIQRNHTRGTKCRSTFQRHNNNKTRRCKAIWSFYSKSKISYDTLEI